MVETVNEHKEVTDRKTPPAARYQRNIHLDLHPAVRFQCVFVSTASSLVIMVFVRI